EKLKRTIAEQNAPPKALPKPTPLVHPQIVNKGWVSGSPGGTGSPAAAVSPLPVAEQKAPPNLMKPTVNLPKATTTPGTTPNTPAEGKKPVPPNLLVAKASGAPGALPTVKSAGTPNGLPTGPGGKPTPTASPGLKQLPGGNVPEGTPSAPKAAVTPPQEKQPEKTPEPTPHGAPAQLT